MVCNRCIAAVQKIFERHHLQLQSIVLGEVELVNEFKSGQMQQLSRNLEELGFEIIDNRKSQHIEQIKNALVQLVHYAKEQPKVTISGYISQKLNHDYNYLSTLFSEVEGVTIEKYHIAQKIERAKELLMYGELTLSQIAYDLGYSSVAYLSSQFKQVTGFTPTHFKTLRDKKRAPLDNLKML